MIFLYAALTAALSATPPAADEPPAEPAPESTALDPEIKAAIGGLIGTKGTQLGSSIGGAAASVSTTVEGTAGGVDVGTLNQALWNRQAALGSCYTEVLKRAPDTKGLVTTTVKFDGDGAAKKVIVTGDSTGVPELGTCLAKALSDVIGGAAGKATLVSTLNPPAPARSLAGEPIILGSLDKSQIDGVIKQSMAGIRRCYQAALADNPQLMGKVTVKFVIAKDGRVESAATKATTLNNPAVEACMNDRFREMTFPEPRAGGIVIVSYPFSFAPG